MLERRHLIGAFFTSLGTLTLEVVLPRIFSVTMWYPIAFLAVSLALMGSAMAGDGRSQRAWRSPCTAGTN